MVFFFPILDGRKIKEMNILSNATFHISDLSHTCEGNCWKLDGFGELAWSLDSFIYFQLSHELEFSW